MSCAFGVAARLFDEFVAEALLQSQEYKWIGFPKRANDTGHKRMKWTRGGNPYAELALLASRRAPCSIKCTVEMREHCTGIV